MAEEMILVLKSYGKVHSKIFIDEVPKIIENNLLNIFQNLKDSLYFTDS